MKTLTTEAHWKPDTLAARTKAGEALDEYLRLAWRDAQDADDKANWSEAELREANIDGKHLMRWFAIGAYEPIIVDPSAKAGSMFISGDSGCSVDSVIGLLQIGADAY